VAKVKKRNNVSDESRRGMSEGGRRGGLRYAEKRRAGTDSATILATKIADFESDLLKQIGANVTAAQRGLIASAAASYGLVLQGRNSISRASRWCGSSDALADKLRGAQGTLLRTLNALGVAKDADDERSAADQAALDSLLDYTKKDGTDGNEAESNRNTAKPE
jgi:hypothetical protein